MIRYFEPGNLFAMKVKTRSNHSNGDHIYNLNF